MHILVLNCGSSSLKGALIHPKSGKRELSFTVERLESDRPTMKFGGEDPVELNCSGHAAALRAALTEVGKCRNGLEISGVGHRVVHGGDVFDQPTLLTPEVEAIIERMSPLAPLHNPVNLAGIRAAKAEFPQLPHVAIFDTAFHRTLPRRARHYALPYLEEVAPDPEKVKDSLLNVPQRFGFHGTSHAFVARKAAEFLQTDLRQLRMITCHLGNGASMAAVEYGRSVETSMGLTPLEGLVMGTRSGDVDPGIILGWMRKTGMSVQEMDEVLNKESGLKGLTGHSNDMRDLIERSTRGDDRARLALQVFTHRIRKYIGAYAAIMNGVDVIVFTGGIGENSPVVRERVTQRLDFLGAILDEDLNRELSLSENRPVAAFNAEHSRAKLLAVATDEQWEIARQAAEVVAEHHKVNVIPAIPIGVSARHVHLTQETVEKLFGKGYHLTERNPLSQPGQFAAHETVALIGPKNTIERVRILGPVRSKNQVEISRTDEFFLGIDAPVRASGHVTNTPGITLEGPAGRVTLKEGLICAWRHIHMTPADAEIFGVEDKDVVEVQVSNGDRGLTFGNVLVRVSEKYALEMHIDTDEANAANLGRDATGVLVPADGEAHLSHRKV